MGRALGRAAPPPSPDNGFYSGQPFSKPVIAGLSSDRKVIGVVGYGYARGLDVRSAKIVWKHALGEYGNPAPNMPLAVGEGVLVYASQSGAVVCVDLATGLLAWTSEPSSAFRGLVGPPTICGGMVLGQCNGGKSLVCWDVRNGKVSWRRSRAAARRREYSRLAASWWPWWTTSCRCASRATFSGRSGCGKYTGHAPALGAATADRVVVLPDRAGNEMDVIWLLSGAVIQTLHLGNIGGSVAAPLPRDWRGTLMCDMDGESLYVTCTRGARGNNVPNPFTGQPGLAGVSVQKFNVRTGKREWQSDIDSEGTTTYFCWRW